MTSLTDAGYSTAHINFFYLSVIQHPIIPNATGAAAVDRALFGLRLENLRYSGVVITKLLLPAGVYPQATAILPNPPGRPRSTVQPEQAETLLL